MMEPFVKITYDAYQLGNGVEDLKGIDQFKAEIHNAYASMVKANPVGRGGGAYDFIVNLAYDITHSEFFKYVAGYFANRLTGGLIDSLVDKLLLNPFKKALSDFKVLHPYIKCHLIIIELSDCTIHLYSTPERDVADFHEKILGEIYAELLNLTVDETFPREIHIPAVEDRIDDVPVYRPPLGIFEDLDLSDESVYFKMWGICNLAPYHQCPYDVANKALLTDFEFIKEDDYYMRKNGSI